MPFCPKCGKGLPLDAAFCPTCGLAVETEAGTNNSENIAPPVIPQEYADKGSARRQQLLDNFYLRLKWERKAWNIAGKVFSISGAVITGVSTILLMLAIINIDDGLFAASMFTYFFSYFFMGTTYLAIGIINNILKGKVDKYMEGLYHDCGPAITRGDSVGMIVFNALFNAVALVFYLINFITVKEHRSEFEEIRRLQLASGKNNTYNQ